MISTPLALSLTHSFTEVGALVAIAGVLGIAVLSVLLFSQGREIKRLREWAGRAPERAAGLEQRMANQRQAAAGAQQQGAVAGVAPQAADGRVTGVRPVPRVTPLVTHATVAAAAAAGGTAAAAAQAAPAAAGQGTNSAPGGAPASPAPALTPAAAATTAAAATAAAQHTASSPPGTGSPPASSSPPDPNAPAAQPGGAPAVAAPGALPPATAAGVAAGVAASQPQAAGSAPPQPAAPSADPSPPGSASTPVPASPPGKPTASPVPAAPPAPNGPPSAIPVAAQAQSAPARLVPPGAVPPAPVPSSPASPSPESPSAESPSALPVPVTAAAAERASNGDGDASPIAALAEREPVVAAVAESAGAVARPRYPPSPPDSGASDESAADADPDQHADARSSERRLPDPSEFRYLRDEPRRRGGHRWLLIAGVVLAGVVAAVVVVLATGGGGGSPAASTTGAANVAHPRSHTHAPAPAAHHSAVSASGPAQLHVVVLNSTEINGLAHRVAGTLQEHGFHQAQALAAHPAGSYTSSVVEYAPGYTSSAEEVARALGVETANVKPMESGTSSLASGASVVVIAAGNESSGGSTG
jgi:hypothetical protein